VFVEFLESNGFDDDDDEDNDPDLKNDPIFQTNLKVILATCPLTSILLLLNYQILTTTPSSFRTISRTSSATVHLIM
jgi:hypothetical protein